MSNARKKTKRRRDTHMMHCLDWHCEELKNSVARIDAREDRLYEAIYAEFPPRDSHHYAAMALIEIYFPRTVQLIALGSNALAYIELYAVLEFFLLSFLPEKLAKHDSAHRIIGKQIERKNLPELAEAARELGLWTADDFAFIKRLARIRNALAHRNYDLLHKALGSPSLDSFEFSEELDKRIERRGASSDLATALRLIIKFTRHKRKKEGENGVGD